MGSSSKIILGLILGGMMAIDMGGPFNKAAYVFGTAAIAAGNYDIMAAVMVGGMVPPCAIALATLLFKDRFTKEERESGPTNFIMGLAFITEGAIPFCSSRPASCASGMYCGIWSCRCNVHGIWLYPDGTSRWNLRSSGYGKCSAVCECTGSGNCCFRSAPGSSEKEKCLTMDVQTGSNIGCGMNGNSCLEKICRYNRVIVKVMNSNIIVNSD